MESIQSLWVSWSEECLAYAGIMAAASSRAAFDGRQELRRLQVDDFLNDRVDFGEFVVPEEDFWEDNVYILWAKSKIVSPKIVRSQICV